KAAKRRKLNEEVEDLKRHLEIVPDEVDDVYTEATPLARKLQKYCIKDLKRHLEIVPDEDDDVYTEATPLARKVPVVDYEIIKINNKPYYKSLELMEHTKESKDSTWSSKGQELEATGIMWCAYHNIYNHAADFVSGKKHSSTRTQQATRNRGKAIVNSPQPIYDQEPSMVRILKEQNNIDKALESCAQSLEIDNLKHILSEHLKEKESLEQKATLLKNDFQKEESRNIDKELGLEKQNELSAEQAFWSQYSVNSEKPNLSSSTTIVEVPKELPKVSMVNSSLKKLKFHLASFDVVVKERPLQQPLRRARGGSNT
nr:hypothetical protein [Tanacetum cinerariifolium]